MPSIVLMYYVRTKVGTLDRVRLLRTFHVSGHPIRGSVFEGHRLEDADRSEMVLILCSQ